MRSATPHSTWEIVLRRVSIHALLAECDNRQPGGLPRSLVSIHALLAECDCHSGMVHITHRGFNPRTPCGVRRLDGRYVRSMSWFQSTHSLRSATPVPVISLTSGLVSIHALLAECDMTWKGIRLFAKSFNPRTPCGVRRFRCWWRGQAVRFQSTHSLRSATKLKPLKKGNNYVSIHALLAECDFSGFVIQHQGYCFNPRTPCGVRLRATRRLTQTCEFQSTHSLRSATALEDLDMVHMWFQSTHSLRSAT